MHTKTAVQLISLSALVIAPALADSHDQYNAMRGAPANVADFDAMPMPSCPTDPAVCPATAASCSNSVCVGCHWYHKTCCHGQASDPAACSERLAHATPHATPRDVAGDSDSDAVVGADSTMPTMAAAGWGPEDGTANNQPGNYNGDTSTIPDNSESDPSPNLDLDPDTTSNDDPAAASPSIDASPSMPTLAVGPEMGFQEKAAASAASADDASMASVAAATPVPTGDGVDTDLPSGVGTPITATDANGNETAAPTAAATDSGSAGASASASESGTVAASAASPTPSSAAAGVSRMVGAAATGLVVGLGIMAVLVVEVF